MRSDDGSGRGREASGTTASLRAGGSKFRGLVRLNSASVTRSQQKKGGGVGVAVHVRRSVTGCGRSGEAVAEA